MSSLLQICSALHCEQYQSEQAASTCMGFTAGSRTQPNWEKGGEQKSLKSSSDEWNMAVMLISSNLQNLTCLVVLPHDVGIGD